MPVISLHVADTSVVDKGCAAEGIACLAPNLAWDNAGRGYKVDMLGVLLSLGMPFA